MDHIRRAAFTNNQKMLECQPPVFMSDSAFPKSLLIYDTSCSQDKFSKGHANLYKVDNLQVVGGAMLHTKRVRVPVTILFSKAPDPTLSLIMMHVAHAPMWPRWRPRCTTPHSAIMRSVGSGMSLEMAKRTR